MPALVLKFSAGVQTVGFVVGGQPSGRYGAGDSHKTDADTEADRAGGLRSYAQKLTSCCGRPALLRQGNHKSGRCGAGDNHQGRGPHRSPSRRGLRSYGQQLACSVGGRHQAILSPVNRPIARVPIGPKSTHDRRPILCRCRRRWGNADHWVRPWPSCRNPRKRCAAG